MASDEQQRYTEIIDNILATADLETISRKKVRQGLETRLGGKDLSVQKVWPRKESRCVKACVAVTLLFFVAFVFEIMSQVLSSLFVRVLMGPYVGCHQTTHRGTL